MTCCDRVPEVLADSLEATYRVRFFTRYMESWRAMTTWRFRVLPCSFSAPEVVCHQLLDMKSTVISLLICLTKLRITAPCQAPCLTSCWLREDWATQRNQHPFQFADVVLDVVADELCDVLRDLDSFLVILASRMAMRVSRSGACGQRTGP